MFKLRYVLLGCALALPIPAGAVQLGHEWKANRNYITITGDIEPNDDDKFAQYTKYMPRDLVFIVLNSDGGDAIAGMNIGLHVRDMGWTTVVYSNRVCASACSMIWLAGKTRWTGSNAHIGFHGVYGAATKQCSASGNALAGAYLRDMDLTFDAIKWLLAAPPSSVEWLTAPLAQKLGIAMQISSKW